MVVINAISMTAGVFTFIFAYIVSFDVDLLLVARASAPLGGRRRDATQSSYQNRLTSMPAWFDSPLILPLGSFPAGSSS